ncbi:MAG: hypothetical protein ACFFDK_00750 [Promethearchaeota archaeon]
MQRRYRQRQVHCQRQAKLFTGTISAKPYHRKILRKFIYQDLKS